MAKLTLDEFVKAFMWARVAFAEGFTGECVQLIRMYVWLVLGFPQFKPVPGADDIPLLGKMPPELWMWVENGRDNFPPAGAVVIWDYDIVPPEDPKDYGHVAIALDGCDAKVLHVFEQNRPLYSGAHESWGGYKSVRGWFIPTPPEPEPEPGAWVASYLAEHGIDVADEAAARAALEALFAPAPFPPPAP